MIKLGGYKHLGLRCLYIDFMVICLITSTDHFLFFSAIPLQEIGAATVRQLQAAIMQVLGH